MEDREFDFIAIAINTKYKYTFYKIHCLETQQFCNMMFLVLKICTLFASNKAHELLLFCFL